VPKTSLSVSTYLLWIWKVIISNRLCYWSLWRVYPSQKYLVDRIQRRFWERWTTVLSLSLDAFSNHVLLNISSWFNINYTKVCLYGGDFLLNTALLTTFSPHWIMINLWTYITLRNLWHFCQCRLWCLHFMWYVLKKRFHAFTYSTSHELCVGLRGGFAATSTSTAAPTFLKFR
jgi:hypothetical protein